MSKSSSSISFSLRTTIKCSGCKQQIPKEEKRAHDQLCAARDAERIECDRCGKLVMRSSLARHIGRNVCIDIWLTNESLMLSAERAAAAAAAAAQAQAAHEDVDVEVV